MEILSLKLYQYPDIIISRGSVNKVNIKFIETTACIVCIVYGIIENDELKQSIYDIENFVFNLRKLTKCWKFVNELTGQKSTKKGIIKANSNEERINKWYIYFRDLLSNKNTIKPVITIQIYRLFSLQKMNIYHR